MPITRTSLILRLRANADPTGWHEFVQLYEPLFRSVARRAGVPAQDIPDVVQEILIRLLRALPGFDYAPERGRFRGWLCAVGRSVIIDWQRRQSHHLRACPLDAETAVATDERQWILEHHRHILRHALAVVHRQISGTAWTCFEQYVLQQQPVAVVADRLNLTPDAVYVIASRVRTRLRNKCAQFDEDLT